MAEDDEMQSNFEDWRYRQSISGVVLIAASVLSPAVTYGVGAMMYGDIGPPSTEFLLLCVLLFWLGVARVVGA